MVTDVLITVLASRLILRCRHRHLHHARGAAGNRALYLGFERLVAVGHGAQQHGQIDARHQPRMGAVHQLLRHVAGRGAEHVGQHQHLRARPARQQLCQRDARGAQRLVGRDVGQHVERGHEGLAVGEHVQRTLPQRLRERRMGNDENAVHADGTASDRRLCGAAQRK
jgi:hypothetical protein